MKRTSKLILTTISLSVLVSPSVGATPTDGPQTPTLSLPEPESPRPAPLGASDAERWAFDVLRSGASEAEVLASWTARLPGLGGPGTGVRVRELRAVLAQSLADETNGRDRQTVSPYWGAGGQSGRRDLRQKLVALLRAHHADRAAAGLEPLVAWLVFDEVDLRNVQAGLVLLRALPSSVRKGLARRLVCGLHPNVEALALGLGISRGIPRDCEAEVRLALRAHPHARVREALASIGIPADSSSPQPFSPSVRIVDRFREVPLIGAPPATDSLAESLLALRAGDEREAREALSPRGMLTAQFEPGFVSLRELQAALALDRAGRVDDAHRILTPRHAEVPDARWLEWAARDLIGHQLHQLMLDRWVEQRDLQGALQLARVLATEAFDGFGYQPRAKGLLRELEQRRDDYAAFSLPTAGEWERRRRGMSRPAQIAWLAERVRLINTLQWGQPGGVNHLDPQYGRAFSELLTRGRDTWAEHERINPLSELLALAPRKGEERALLEPYRRSRAHLALYSYWRDFHPARELHTVGEAVVWLLAELDARGGSG